MDRVNTKIKKTHEGGGSKENIEVWEDLVHIKDLVLSLIICSVLALGGYFIAPDKPPRPLLFGLSGAIIGFVICSIFVKPKRIFIETDQEHND